LMAVGFAVMVLASLGPLVLASTGSDRLAGAAAGT
jgi:hypothetical protein